MKNIKRPFLTRSNITFFGRFTMFFSVYGYIFLLGLLSLFYNNPDNKGLLYFSIIILIIWVLSYTYFFYLFKELKNGKHKKITITSLEPDTKSFTEYLFSYLIPLITFGVFNLVEMYISILVFLILLYYVMNSKLLFINPILLFLGYKYYQVWSNEYKNPILLISNNEDIYKVKEETIYMVSHLDMGVYLGWGIHK